ncbi:MAG TPA: hypothetical protein VFQ39_13980 [Longimicrobium sp.]|nr:hypothetical protein [Longimicrobium sp.]
MGRSIRLGTFAVAMVLLAACGQSGGENPVLPTGPRFDGGLAIGGNATGTPPTTGESPTTAAASNDVNSEPAPVDSTGTERGGLAIGGN